MFLYAPANNSKLRVERKLMHQFNFVGFQPVSPGLVEGSPCLRFGLLDEGSYGWIQGFGSLLVIIFSLLIITHVLFKTLVILRWVTQALEAMMYMWFLVMQFQPYSLSDVNAFV